MRARAMRQLSKVRHRRHQWQHQAQQRGDCERYQRTQLLRITAERDRATPALKETQARLRQIESHAQAVAVLAKVAVVWRALQLFVAARLGVRAVSRVLSLLACARGIKKAPCPHTLIHWVRRLAIVRIQAARRLRGSPLSHAPCSPGFRWMIDRSMGLGTGKR